MAENEESKSSPPYGSFGTFWNYITGLKAETLPPQLDRTMMRGKSGSDQAVINMALKFFGLVDPDRNNKVLDSLKRIVAADSKVQKTILGELVRTHYPAQMAVSDRLGTEKQLHESFETTFGLSGETRRKAATFFLHAAATAGIQVSPNFPKARAGQGRAANGAAKKAAARKRPSASATKTKNEGGGDTYTVELECGGTVQLIVTADLMSLLRHDGDRKMVTGLIEKMESYEGGDAVEAGVEDEIDTESETGP
ncbi:MAG TPA: hypothetical protein VGR26_17120 [Acidimicrobiales bacterium]|nr:hypothetical protein [Acidimicrobiales bacterium]